MADDAVDSFVVTLADLYGSGNLANYSAGNGAEYRKEVKVTFRL